MKKIFNLVIATAFVSGAFAQTTAVKDVPAMVTTTLTKTFPTATNATWTLENSVYTATFTADKVNHSLKIDSKGTLVQTSTELAKAEVPGPIATVIAGDYSRYGITSVAKVEKDGETTYKAFFTQPDGIHYILFNKDGKAIGKGAPGIDARN